MSDFKDEKRQERWMERWEKFAMDNLVGRILVSDWKYELNELTKFNGLPNDRQSKEIVAYEIYK